MQIEKEHIEKNIKDFFLYVEQTGEPVIITDQNKIPVLKLLQPLNLYHKF